MYTNDGVGEFSYLHVFYRQQNLALAALKYELFKLFTAFDDEYTVLYNTCLRDCENATLSFTLNICFGTFLRKPNRKCLQYAASWLSPLRPLPCDVWCVMLMHDNVTILGGHDVRHYLRWRQGQVWPTWDQYWDNSWSRRHSETHQSCGKVKVELRV